MDLNLLRVLVAIVDQGSLSAAARSLRLSRSQISRQLKRLEQELGTQLVRRTTRRMELTHQGLLVHGHAVRALEEIRTARETVQHLGAEPRGHVRVSVPTGLGDLLLARMLTDFVRRHEGITIGIQFSNRVSDLISSRVDVAVRVVAEPPLDYVARHVTSIGWMLCASPTYLQSHPPIRKASDLESHDVLLPPSDRQSSVISFVRGARRVQARVRAKLASESFGCLANAACQGAGVALLPSYCANVFIREKALVPVLENHAVERPDKELYILRAPNPYANTASKALIEYLDANLEREINQWQ